MELHLQQSEHSYGFKVIEKEDHIMIISVIDGVEIFEVFGW